jgi:hypothetical protein
MQFLSQQVVMIQYLTKFYHHSKQLYDTLNNESEYVLILIHFFQNLIESILKYRLFYINQANH